MSQHLLGMAVLICSGALTMQLSGQIEQETEAHTEVMSAEVADLIFRFSTGFFFFFFLQLILCYLRYHHVQVVDLKAVISGK